MTSERVVHRQPVTALPASVAVSGSGSPIPIYHELASKLQRVVESGELPPGSRLEDEITLARQLNISRPTVRRAIQVLVDRGLLVRRRGIGTLVVPPPPLTRELELTSLWDDLHQMGKHPATEVLQLESVAADAETASLLGVEAGAALTHLRRLRIAEGAPLAILENLLPEHASPLTREELIDSGLYEALGRRGIIVRVAHQAITAREGTKEETALLQLPAKAPLLSMVRTAYDGSGRAVEHGRHLYRPDRYAFETTLTRP